MEFQNDVDSQVATKKSEARLLLCKRKGPREVDEKIAQLEGWLERPDVYGHQNEFSCQLTQLKNWKQSAEFQNGEYPAGIDQLFFELIGWRSTIEAFGEVETVNQPFDTNIFFSQWHAGGTFAVFSLIGQLLSKDRRDNSLTNFFQTYSKHIKPEEGGLLDTNELEAIKKALENRETNAIKFRNKVIAHNEHAPLISWRETDEHIKAICRAWGIATMWVESPVILPFEPYTKVFKGLSDFFNPREIQLLESKQSEYLGQVYEWCIQSILSGEQIGNRKPYFREIRDEVTSFNIPSSPRG